jgi:XTP/dITP diphosphohydrolase
MRIVLATGNPAKLQELTTLLSPWQIEVVPQSAFSQASADETGLTFVENAILKARHAAALSGLPAIADDSGLEVDALQGRPGIHSARFAGPGASDADNLQKLLKDLEDVPDALRTARYRCALVWLRFALDPAPIVCQASWEGVVIRERRGAGGFGYDPVFRIAGLEQTAAEIPAADKNRLSHRGQALRMLVRELELSHAFLLPPVSGQR